MIVIAIIACSLVGTIGALLLVGTAWWSFIYLICQRIGKRAPRNPHFEVSATRDVLAVVIAIITLIAVAAMLLFGVPFVAKHFSELPLLPAA